MTKTPVEVPKSCCSPSRGVDTCYPAAALHAATPTSMEFDTADIPGGLATIGTKTPQISGDGESPMRTKKLAPFRMGTTQVTNQMFRCFVEDTGYKTEAESFGWSFVFRSDVPSTITQTPAVEGVEWWRRVEGANWRDVHGPDTQDKSWYPDHPVVHASWNDAVQFAKWAGGRLPSEAEWEHAARGGLGDVRFPWGNKEPDDRSNFPCNIWQGNFPETNTYADGWASTAPASSFEPNAYGLFNMVGNVWEWTADAYQVKSLKKQVRQRLENMRGFKVLKGGSFLCH